MRILLKQIRLNSNLTQQQLAKKLGISRVTYTNIELGEKNPSLNLALKIKKLLNTDDDNIFLNSNEPERNNKCSA